MGRSLAYPKMSITVARIDWLCIIVLQPGYTAGEGHPGLGRYQERKEVLQTWNAVRFAARIMGFWWGPSLDRNPGRNRCCIHNRSDRAAELLARKD